MKDAFIKCSFDNWTKMYPLVPKEDQITKNLFYRCKLLLPPGIYEYKFIIDNNWVFDPLKPKVSDNNGGFNNEIRVADKKITSCFSDKNLTTSLQMMRRY